MKYKKYFMPGAAAAVLVVIIYFAVANKSKAPVVSYNNGNEAKTAAPAAPSGGGMKTTSSAPQVAPSGIYVVSYENSGFKPNVLEIARGTSVKFLNNSTKAMRIGPADQNNPAQQSLNQPKTVGKGGYYDYSFVNPGVYEYANMSNTADKGKITVK